MLKIHLVLTFAAREAKLIDSMFLKNFIEIIPKYESRYTSHAIKYLHPHLNVNKLYDHYQENCYDEGQKVMSLSYFSKKIKKINLKFPKGRTRACHTCTKLESDMKRNVISPETRAKLGQKKKEHSNLTEKNVNDFQNEVEQAKYFLNDTEILTFSLGQSIDLPQTSPADYTKRSLWLHEICFFDEVRHLSHIYAWPESVASKGSQEISSSVIHHLHKTLPPQTKQLILYCDPYFGQNRNMNLSLTLQYFLDSWPHANLISIQQRFFVSGHGFNN